MTTVTSCIGIEEMMKNNGMKYYRYITVGQRAQYGEIVKDHYCVDVEFDNQYVHLKLIKVFFDHPDVYGVFQDCDEKLYTIHFEKELDDVYIPSESHGKFVKLNLDLEKTTFIRLLIKHVNAKKNVKIYNGDIDEKTIHHNSRCVIV
jgi:hypothetical protein